MIQCHRKQFCMFHWERRWVNGKLGSIPAEIQLPSQDHWLHWTPLSGIYCQNSSGYEISRLRQWRNNTLPHAASSQCMPIVLAWIQQGFNCPHRIIGCIEPPFQGFIVETVQATRYQDCGDEETILCPTLPHRDACQLCWHEFKDFV